MTTANDKIVDLFAEHDIDLRKVDGHLRNEVDRIITQLGRDLKALLVRIDPHGATRQDARRRRVKRLQDEARPVIRAAYVEIGRLSRKNLRRLAKVESKAALGLVDKALP